MPPADRVDIGYVAHVRRANSASRRRLPPAVLWALCLCLCAGTAASSALASTAPGTGSTRASSAASHTSHLLHGKRVSSKHAHKARCAKPSSFHARSGRPNGGAHTKRGHRRTRCRKVGHSKARHGGSKHAGTRHAGSRHAGTHHAAANPSSSCPGADLRPSADNLEEVRAATLCLVNRERSANGESALSGNGHLQQAAQGHSEDMASGDYFEHNGPGGDTPLERMRGAGYIVGTNIGFEVGENIGWGTLWLASPRSMVASWMASPGHRANILDVHFRDTGVGVSPHPLSSAARGQAGAIYTQDFGVLLTS
jgi:uncharacterized protein YkwD